MPETRCCIWLMTAFLLLAEVPTATISMYFLVSTSRVAVTEVVIFNDASSAVVATVKGLKNDFSGLMSDKSMNVSIKAYSFTTLTLPTDMNMNATGVYDNNAISVQSSSNISLLMYSVTPNIGNLIKSPHIEFFRKLFYPITPNCSNYFVLHMVANAISVIHITFPSNQANTLFTTYKAISYYGGDTLMLELSAHSTALVESLADLTGTSVTADKPIGMFSGCDYSSTHDVPDYRSDMVPGQKDMGLQYVIMALTETSFSFEGYVIVSTLENTTVITYADDTCNETKLRKSGDIHAVTMSAVNEIVVSSKPVVVVHMAYNEAGSHNMYYVTPVSMFRTEYLATSFKDMAMQVKITFRNGTENSFVVNGQPITVDVRDDPVDDLAAVGRLGGAGVFLNNKVNPIKSQDPYIFGGYMWSVDNDDRLFITSLGRKTTRQHTVCMGDKEPLDDGCVEPLEGCHGSKNESNAKSNPSPKSPTSPQPTNLTTPTPESPTSSKPTNVTIPTSESSTSSKPTNVTILTSGSPTSSKSTNVTIPTPGNLTSPQPTNVTIPTPGSPTIPQHTNVTIPTPGSPTSSHPTNVTIPTPGSPTSSQPTNVTIPTPGSPTSSKPTNVTIPQHTGTMATPQSSPIVNVPQPIGTTAILQSSSPIIKQTTTTTNSQATIPTTTLSKCPTSARKYDHHGQVICYWLLVTTATIQNQAYDLCLQQGGQLPIIPNSEANEVVVNLISTSNADSFFLDYKVNYTSGKISRSSGSPQDWINGVDTTQPSGPCVVINGTGTWSSSVCDVSPYNGVVCSACQGGGTSCYTQNKYCGSCSCPNYIVNTINITAELQKDLDNLRKATIVNRKDLSKTLRRKTCASDPRPSSTAMGYLGASVLTIVFGGWILLDLPLLFLEFKTHILGLFQG